MTSAPERLDEPEEVDEDSDLLRARIELLTEENRRLRSAYGRIRRTRHRWTAVGLGVLGGISFIAAVSYPSARTVLIVLGAIGLFGGLLTWFITPERFVAAEVGERTYAALSENEASIAAELDLKEERVYVPRLGDPIHQVALFIPQATNFRIPSTEDLDEVFVVTDDPATRGLSLEPTGGQLLKELFEGLPEDLANDPAEITNQLADGVRDGLELVDHVRLAVESEEGSASIAISGSAWGAIDRFDHPVASLFAVGLAVGLELPVRIEVDRTPEANEEYLITASWSESIHGGGES